MKKLIAATIMVAIFTWQQAFASLQGAEEVFTSGKWRVVMSADMMTDEKSCTGLHIDKGYAVQLNEKAMYTKVTGGMRLVTIRLDDAKPTKRVPTNLEEKIRAVTVNGSQFQDLMSANRFRMQVLTRIKGLSNLDMDITGISEAHDYIVNKCGE